MHTYTVDSDFGVFEVTGDFAIRKLIREIWAIAQLREVMKSQAYMDDIKKAASQPLEFGANMLTDPVDTVSGVPKGIARLFGNVKTGLTTKDSTGEDSKVEQALAPVGGPAVAAVSITKTAQQVSDVVKDYPPQRLREMNEQKLLAMGVPSSLTAQFLDHPSYTPTRHTVIAHSLEALPGAQGRAAFVQQALSADDEETANFFMYIAETMRGYARKGSPIREISVYGPLVFAKAANGVVLIPLPLDYGIWTERASQRVPMAVSAFKAANPDVKKYDVWVTGTVSKLVKEEMGKLGLQVVEKVDKQVGYVY
jgi:hypothetical protein